MSRTCLDDLFMTTLGELRDAEAQLAMGLPVLQRAAIDPDLEELITEMRQSACGQMARLEAIYDMLGKEPQSEACWSIASLLVDACDAARARDRFTRHCGIGLALLSILHLQIIRLQSLAAWSLRCQLDELAGLLELPLAEKVVFARRLAAHALAADRLAAGAEPTGRTLN